MKVILAGYNVDTEVLEDLKKTSRPRQDVTPETISASYARISRDPRAVDELRKIAREEVEKSRKSNSAIIFKMGHHSIAEHAVFNFDILGVSRLALEEIEKFRLCAYTEKSQRYQKLEDDFLIPDEIKGSQFEKDFVETIRKQNKFYHELIGKGIEPEDARYVTSLATEGQLGQTINARNLEFLFRRFASSPLAEVRKLGQTMFKLVEPIAPSIILFTEANDFDQKTYLELRAQTSSRGFYPADSVRGSTEHRTQKGKTKNEVELIDYTKDADNKTVAALLHTSTNLSFKKCLKAAKKMSAGDKKDLIKTCFKYAEFYDKPQREFEYVDLTFDLVVSAACFGQLKRHRLATLTSQLYDPGLGVTIPESIVKCGMEKQFKRIINITNKAYAEFAKNNFVAAQYVLTNAHRKRVLIKVNARELYHISRLREDTHAQWDIAQISAKMCELAKKVMPATMLFIGGKDSYSSIYESHFGKKPKILPEY
ncbi:MAG: FAD-dependent thymidylate synthase [Candidatus Saganbacteria bacterium]|nr:FAD-dependent thymidylate synthase [Candidatus Saganbacteria bacterium]